MFVVLAGVWAEVTEPLVEGLLMYPAQQLMLPNLSKADVANMFGVSSRTVDNWVSRGHLKPTRVGGLVRFSLVDVAHLVASGNDNNQ